MLATPAVAVGADQEDIRSPRSGVNVNCDGESGIAKLVWKPFVVLVSEATLDEPTRVTIRTWNPAGTIGLLELGDALGEALGEADGVEIEARPNRMLAVPVVICGLGDALGEGAMFWFRTF